MSVNRNSAALLDSDIVMFTNTVPPPPYPGNEFSSINPQYDLTPTPHIQNRPRLPEDRRNPHLRNLPEDVTIVKFQTIVRDGREIVVGRIKIPTPGQHAFILRRYDTNAISLTTMFKVAFPGATEEEEKKEMDWIKSSYDMRNTNGGRDNNAVRLAGQWVSRHLAIHLAPAYGILDLVSALARAAPDPNVAYRKSQRSQAAADDLDRRREPEGNATTPAHPVPTLTVEPSASPAPKRQRRQSPTAVSSFADPIETDSQRLTLEATTTVTAPIGARVDMEAEIESAKQLVLDLKKELRLRAAAGEDLEDQGVEVSEESRGTKRGKGEGDGVIISGSGAGTQERIVRRNKRVQQGIVGEGIKKAFWTAAIFGLGVTAASFFPQVLSNFL